ncbi:hypothetical protein [Wukongibacter sp. M2B1]|uniref:hypothetical protein n=1 Tax=Wukongibacter sp. M2B1 TaxID=3088895 RepID=UPI003D7B18F5
MKVNILVGGRRFEDLPISEQMKVRDRITNAQRNIVETKLSIMINEGKSDKEIREYLGL